MASGGGGGGGYHNHHHHGQQQQMQRKGGGSNPKSPIVGKAVDEMIGVPVPRKARSGTHAAHRKARIFRPPRRFHPHG
jgi:hypothetical protein